MKTIFKGRWARRIAFTILTLIILFLILAASARQSEVQQDIVYANASGTELKLDMVQPKGDGPFPLIIWIHGGAWQIGDRKDCHESMIGFARLGYVGAAVQYRFAPKYKYPAQLEDVQAALAFLRKNAKIYKIDPERIGVVGGSAGAQLALLLGLAKKDGKPSGVKAIVNFSGPTDFPKWTIPEEGEAQFRKGFHKDLNGMLADFLGTSDRNAKIMAEASPVTYVGKDSPPVLTIHGAADVLVPVTQAQLLHDALKKAGVTETLMVVEGVGHEYGKWPAEKSKATFVAMMAFVDKHLQKKGP